MMKPYGKRRIFMDYAIFKDRLNYLFRRRGLSINSLAPELGMSAPTLSRYLSGKRAPDTPYLLAISDYFQISIDWLLGLEDGREAIKNDVNEIANLYSIASLDDRKIVHAVLDKYRGSTDITTNDTDSEVSPKEE